MDRIKSVANLFKTQKLLLALSLVLVIAVALLALLFRPQEESTQRPPETEKTGGKTGTIETGEDKESDFEEPIEDEEEFEKKETGPNGTTVYTLKSSVPQRPNQTVTFGKRILYDRLVYGNENPAVISDYLDSFGEPDKKIAGNSYYGSNSEIWIYSDIGTAIVVASDKKTVLEQHLFPENEAENYINNYSQL